MLQLLNRQVTHGAGLRQRGWLSLRYPLLWATCTCITRRYRTGISATTLFLWFLLVTKFGWRGWTPSVNVEAWESPKLDFNWRRREMSGTHPPRSWCKCCHNALQPPKIIGYTFLSLTLFANYRKTKISDLCKISVLQNGSMTVSVPLSFLFSKNATGTTAVCFKVAAIKLQNKLGTQLRSWKIISPLPTLNCHVCWFSTTNKPSQYSL